MTETGTFLPPTVRANTRMQWCAFRTARIQPYKALSDIHLYLGVQRSPRTQFVNVSSKTLIKLVFA